MDIRKILIKCAKSGDSFRFKQIAKNYGVDETILFGQGNSLLHSSSLGKKVGFNSISLDLIRKYDLKIDAQNACGSTPFHMSAVNDNDIFIPLGLSRVRRADYTRYLDIKEKLNDNTALHTACSFGSFASFLSLCMHGATFNLKNRQDKTPLELCDKTPIKTVLEILSNLFHYAVLHEHHWRNFYMQLFYNKIDMISNSPSSLLAVAFAKECDGFTLPQKLVINRKFEALVRIQDLIVKCDGSIYVVPKAVRDHTHFNEVLEKLVIHLRLMEKLKSGDPQINVHSMIQTYVWSSKRIIRSIYQFCEKKWDMINMEDQNEYRMLQLILDPLGQVAHDCYKLLTYDAAGRIYMPFLNQKVLVDVNFLDTCIDRPLRHLWRKLRAGKCQMMIRVDASNTLFEEFCKVVDEDEIVLLGETIDNFNLLHLSSLLNRYKYTNYLLCKVSGTETLQSHKERFVNLQTYRMKQTALHLAVPRKDLSLLLLLLSHGAVYNAKNSSGKTPLNLCCNKNNPITKLLEDITYFFSKSTKTSSKINIGPKPKWVAYIEELAEHNEFRRCLAILHAKDAVTNSTLTEIKNCYQRNLLTALQYVMEKFDLCT